MCVRSALSLGDYSPGVRNARSRLKLLLISDGCSSRGGGA